MNMKQHHKAHKTFMKKYSIHVNNIWLLWSDVLPVSLLLDVLVLMLAINISNCKYAAVLVSPMARS